VRQDYAGAYSMTSADLRKQHSLPWLEAQIERLRQESDDPLGPCHVTGSLSGPLPNRTQPIEGAVYVTIRGINCEGVFVSVTRANGRLEIDEILGIGRP
jgi:hypothetical protein